VFKFHFYDEYGLSTDNKNYELSGQMETGKRVGTRVE
jgi:hypothetical protein